MSEGPTTSAQAGSFAVTLPVFTGPFRLLAELILEQKVDVCDVRVADVTDHYLEHTKQAEGWNLEEATWFLAICAVLLELKVGRLMPTHAELDEDDLPEGVGTEAERRRQPAHAVLIRVAGVDLDALEVALGEAAAGGQLRDRQAQSGAGLLYDVSELVFKSRHQAGGLSVRRITAGRRREW